MKDERRPPERRPQIVRHDRTRPIGCVECQRLRAGIWHAIEAHEDGNPRHACDLLLTLAEDDFWGAA
jgi:hypothetical protein